MTTNHDAGTDSAPPSPEATGLASGSASGLASNSRRRLLRGGLAAAPVMLTLASPKVMATSSTCTSVSVLASMNASHPHASVPCSSRSPATWAGLDKSYWPSGVLPTDAFTKHLQNAGPCGTATMLQVLKYTETSGTKCVAKYMAAAFLNAKWDTPFATNVMNAAKVKTIWTNYTPNYWYVPTTGGKLYADSATPTGLKGMNPWLKGLMP